MIDLWSWEFWQQHSLYLMFVSAFLSATVLPGNSEVVFIGLLTPLALNQNSLLNEQIISLFMIAVLGNSLGSFSTYWLGRLLPQLSEKQQQHPRFEWVVNRIQHYGIWSLFFSWLPVVGDMFCAVAGWLRINMFGALILITFGKLVRYLFLLLLTMNLFAI
ncbi:DedA family protein [Pasteurella canis]|uniref:YqaA family protein n=1 Tax=Pasteurella canis TaxID=753 RepID=UPI001CC33386|nr:YqaA family protein [Pasteurella canis]UAY77858.1 DedA family protein [Pasteurella canis]